MSTVETLATDRFIPAINLFVTKHCNMRCRFCFGSCKMRSPLSSQDQDGVFVDVIRQCHQQGISKITFVGGEPLLYPKLKLLIRLAHDLGITTCVVSNGALLTKEWLREVSGMLDWIGISIDSLSVDTNWSIGRISNGVPMSKLVYEQLVDWVHDYGMRLKINTTVCRWNHHEDMSSFYRDTNPHRIKMFQALTIDGVNDEESTKFSVSDEQFTHYVERHLRQGIKAVAEASNDMVGSYLMVSPDGCFFDNTHGSYRLSRPISRVGFSSAIKDISVNHTKFMDRGGMYRW
ncbi:viperin family antiviral radical SAM protein [Pseudodesulfovibrio piezophilus]|uniref:S-adenosylmethionine-dependent nucleotide dehydratase n=1 Tax=Pseudodesulfovibrio piezophilus (strain DSM 21447 / JCM 15486 / C1TLV30) TaxID=1322246 RepID=M1WKF0_PSEP2|nr:viperin family antiviral radical SAM protein [Pseudodesulfovibrio piezophilus]CCH49486.1 Predicted Fe-S oxidoreductases [Pseudodesulfovibrio piezophilus C1TLV30]